ncbi:hypothetical protein ACHHRT_09410 [Desulfurivibrio sp. D14AmB]|uniref:hypothetical protein n=1 Tax=Desulfurivibrio sp. D14AmB TaxID=3374370 RepID=UPI00376F014B
MEYFQLLQIIIFAQEEFAERLAAKPNFQDRINLLYRLRPLSFAETRAAWELFPQVTALPAQIVRVAASPGPVPRPDGI